MGSQNYSTSVEIYAWAGGQVTPSCLVIEHFSKRIMHDCGIEAVVSAEPQIPADIDFVVLSHPHIDHVGWVLHFWMKNKCPIYTPKWTKRAIWIALRRTHKIQSWESNSGNRYAKNKLWLQKARENLNDFCNKLNWEATEQSRPIPMNRNGRKEQSMSHHQRKEQQEIDEREKSGRIEASHDELRKTLWLQEYDLYDHIFIRELWESLGIKWVKPHKKDKNHEAEIKYLKEVLTEYTNILYQSRTARLAEEEIITEEDVDNCISSIRELTLGKYHKIFSGEEWGKKVTRKTIEVLFKNSGHLYSAVSASTLYRLGGPSGKIVYASGDVGNDKPWHPYPKIDIEGVDGVADVVIIEGTYGGRNHSDREWELDKFDRLLIEAIKEGADVVIPIISLDRPIFAMWEIVTRLIEKWSKRGKEANLSHTDFECLYLWSDLEEFLPKGTEVWKKIQKYFKPLRPERMQTLDKKWKRSRILLVAGWFLPPKSPAAGVLVHSLKRNNTRVIFVNYCWDENSNARKLLAGEEFKAYAKTRDHDYVRHILKLRWGQSADIVWAFSWHGDQEALLGVIERVSKNWAKILINHSDNAERKALEEIIKKKSRKGLEVVLPRLRKSYPVFLVPKEKNNKK